MTRPRSTFADLRREQPLRFDSGELAGSFGDLGTFLPLSLALAMTCRMDIAMIFIFAGLMNIVTGVWFRQPIPVQPMKAIAAVAIAEGLGAGAIASAGLVMGVAVVLLAIVGGVDWIARVIPKPVVRGIQAGVGIKLGWTGLVWLGALPAVGWDSWLVAAVAGALVLLFVGRRQPVLLYIFAAGFILLGLGNAGVYRGLSFDMPTVALAMPAADDWWTGVTRGAIPQLPLTLLNSVIAVCALSGDYFPGRAIAPRRMAISVGLMNLLCVPFGGMPMCHGAGGLAAQYRFGARTGGSVVMLGAMKVIAGLLLGGVLFSTLQHYPKSILAMMVIVAGFTLAKSSRGSLTGRPAVIVAAMVLAMVLINTLAGFVLGCVIASAFAVSDRFRRVST